MTENPEVDVIARTLRSRYGSNPGGPDFDGEGKEVWSALLHYWKNRAGGKVGTWDQAARIFEEEEKKKVNKAFDDGVDTIRDKYPTDHLPEPPQVYPHINPDLHFPAPPGFNEKLKEADDRVDYEDYISRRIDAIYEELYDLQHLPVFSDKEKRKLDAIAIKLGNFAHKYHTNRNSTV